MEILKTALEELWSLEESDGLVTKIVDYCSRPDLVQWIAKQVGVNFRQMEFLSLFNRYCAGTNSKQQKGNKDDF